MKVPLLLLPRRVAIGERPNYTFLKIFRMPKVKAALPHSWLRTLLAPFMVRRFQSVRTATDTLLQNIEECQFPM